MIIYILMCVYEKHDMKKNISKNFFLSFFFMLEWVPMCIIVYVSNM